MAALCVSQAITELNKIMEHKDTFNQEAPSLEISASDLKCSASAHKRDEYGSLPMPSNSKDISDGGEDGSD